MLCCTVMSEAKSRGGAFFFVCMCGGGSKH